MLNSLQFYFLVIFLSASSHASVVNKLVYSLQELKCWVRLATNFTAESAMQLKFYTEYKGLSNHILSRSI